MNEITSSIRHTSQSKIELLDCISTHLCKHFFCRSIVVDSRLWIESNELSHVAGV